MIAGRLPTVRIVRRTPALAWIILVLEADFQELVITSIGDGEHTEHSAHYRGEAVDIRCHDLPSQAAMRSRADRLEGALGPEFVALVEPWDVPGSSAAPHIHLQLRAGARFTDSDFRDVVYSWWTTPAPAPAPAPVG